MKIALDRKRLHLRFILGTGFVLFLITKGIKKKVPAETVRIKIIGKQVKKFIKDYKRKNGSFNLVEVESEGMRIVVKA